MEGQDTSQIWNAISSLQDETSSQRAAHNSLQGDVSSLAGDVSTLAQALRDLRSYTEDQVRRIEQTLGDLREDIDYMNRNLEDLINQVRTSFDHLQASVTDLTQVTDDGNQTIAEGIASSEETSRKGLEKVSSGVAIVDMLKATAEAQQMGLAINDAIAEIDGSRATAEVSIAEIREVYDAKVHKVHDGLQTQLQRIGQHVVEVQEHVEVVLRTLGYDERVDARLGTSLHGVRTKFTTDRAEQLNTARSKIDRARLEEFKRLFTNLQGLLGDESLLRKERDPGDGEEIQVPPAFGLPVVAVRAVDSTGSEVTDFYCLDSEAHDCYQRPAPPVQFAELTRTIQQACERLDPKLGVPGDDSLLQRLRGGIDGLVEKKLLRTEHAALINEHLNSYTLHWMDS